MKIFVLSLYIALCALLVGVNLWGSLLREMEIRWFYLPMVIFIFIAFLYDYFILKCRDKTAGSIATFVVFAIQGVVAFHFHGSMFFQGYLTHLIIPSLIPFAYFIIFRQKTKAEYIVYLIYALCMGIISLLIPVIFVFNDISYEEYLFVLRGGVCLGYGYFISLFVIFIKRRILNALNRIS